MHRFVYCQHNSITITEIKGKVVRHSCDNSRCIEPTHLILGTQADNVRDMLERGRGSPPPRRFGDLHPGSKLTYEQVRAIRASHASGIRKKDLARQFGVSATNIGYIIKNDIWDEWVSEINARIAPISITANGLLTLGFAPVGAADTSTL